MSEIIKAEPYHLQAYKSLQKMLLERVYPPGERLTELSLAKKLGISRGPIREAMRMLIQDGLLVQKGSHVHVFNPDLEDIIELYDCREGLEPIAAKLAAQHISHETKELLILNLESTEKALKGNETNNNIAALTTEFHDLIVQASGNKQLIKFISLIHAKVTYIRNTLLEDFTRKEDFIKEHRQIAEAIFAGNSDEAEARMRNHMKQDLTAWKSIFANSSTKDDSK